MLIRLRIRFGGREGLGFYDRGACPPCAEIPCSLLRKHVSKAYFGAHNFD